MYISVHQQAAGRRLKIRFTMSRAQRAWVVYVFVCMRTDNNSISFTCSICTNANDICSNTPLYNMLHRATFGAQVAVNNRRIFVLRLKLSSQLHETIFNTKDDKIHIILIYVTSISSTVHFVMTNIRLSGATYWESLVYRHINELIMVRVRRILRTYVEERQNCLGNTKDYINKP